MKLVIHAEGGGEGQLYDTLFRQAWASFFRHAGLAKRMPRVVRGQGREQTIANFIKGLRNPDPGVLPLPRPCQNSWGRLSQAFATGVRSVLRVLSARTAPAMLLRVPAGL